MRITWANHSKRWVLVSNVSMTNDGFGEFDTSDRFPYVWALPQNRWRLRRLRILKYLTHLSCTWWVTVQNRSPSSSMLLIPFQHSHCTLVNILFRTFARLFFNLAMRTRALFPKSATTLGLVEQAFWRVLLITEWIGASSFDVFLAWQSKLSPTATLSSGTLDSRRISDSAAWQNSEKESAVSIYHAYSYRGGNCNCFLSHIARWLSTANNLLKFFVNAVLSWFLTTAFLS